MTTLQSIFDDIYDNDRWNGGSGPGSHSSRTGEYTAFINHLIRDLKIESFLDVGCGDWQLAQWFRLDGIRYKGIDISKSAVALAKNRAPASTDISVSDIFSVTDKFDFVHIKDVLQHLPFEDCDRILTFACKSSRYVLVTNEYPPCSNDIEAGQYRPIDVSYWPNSKIVRIFSSNGFNKSSTLITNDYASREH